MIHEHGPDSPEPVDWVHLPAGVEARSLWSCLHDGCLVRLETDALARTALLDFRVGYVREHGGLPEGVLFRFTFDEVAALRAATFAFWPGPAPEVAGKPMEEQERLVGEWQAKGRSESLSWGEVEAAVAAGPYEVLEADLAEGGGGVALRLGGHLEDDRWCALTLRAASLSVARSDGEPFSLEQLVALGESYWEEFASRRR